MVAEAGLDDEDGGEGRGDDDEALGGLLLAVPGVGGEASEGGTNPGCYQDEVVPP